MADEFSGHCLVINSPTQNNTTLLNTELQQNRIEVLLRSEISTNTGIPSNCCAIS